MIYLCLLCWLGCSGESGQEATSSGDGTPQDLGGLSVMVPQGWVIEKPASQMRKAQYRVSGAGGDAELVVTYFGTRGAGPVGANIKRWQGQFGHVNGLVTEQTINGLKATILDVRGTYSNTMPMGGGSESKPNYRMLAAIVQSPSGPFYFKLTGPQATVGESTQLFDRYLKSLKAN
ncbi:MAG: hypothetical protein O7G87_04315 [bacterium]|nr:hypothetical protein [bacterium]